MGTTRQFHDKTVNKKTHRLQIINITGAVDAPNLYGTTVNSQIDAISDTHKPDNIPWVSKKRLFSITVRPGVRDRTPLRLAVMGRQIDDETRGDLYLKVVIHENL